ncbi:MSC_0620 family F1-like ATPase-associated subunit [Mycoplasmopsis cricetuli]|uniref:MSC_0620 family F1-like ATPase-associated subunit n=1 Tax=Mycoplasmopsis cricetuli TaxID=171283 RepID=UPI00047227CC|nr:hypothetical protein [Mycoplasmopsis cricetuli]
MKKLKKYVRHFFLLLTLPVSIGLTTQISVKTEAKNDSKFNDFSKLVENALNKAFSEAINITISRLEQIQNQLKENNEINFQEKLRKIYYLEVVIAFLKTNKTQIIQNRSKFGFNTIFLNTLSNERKYQIGTITFQDETYNNVIFKLGNNLTDYKNFIGNNGTLKKESDEINILKTEDVQQIIAKYSNEMQKQFKDIIFNEKDIDNLNENLTFETKTITQLDGSSISALTFSPPKEFKNWDEYLKLKYQDRFIKFDLEQNKLKDNESKNQKDNSTNEINPIDSIENENTIFEPVDIEIEKLIEKLPTLPANLKANFINLDLNKISSDANLEQYFFFDNPINTRFKYKLIKLSTTSENSYLADVEISDSINPEHKRTYKIKLNNNKSYGYQKIYESYVNEIKNKFIQLYKSLQLDENLNFKTIEVFNLANTLINLLNTIVHDLYYNETFSLKRDNIIDKYASQINSNTSEKEIHKIVNQLSIQLISSLKTSKINNNALFSVLPNTYKRALKRYNELFIQKKDLSKNLKQLFEKNNLNTTVFYKLIEQTKKYITLAINHSNSLTFDTLKWYDNYTELLNKISNNYNLIKDFIKDAFQENNQNKIDEKKLFQRYNQAKLEITNASYQKKLLLIILGSIMLIFGLSSIALLFFNNINKKQNNKLKKWITKTNIIFILLSTVILICSTVLIVLGIIEGIL